MDERLIHDAAWATAHHLVGVFAPLLHEWEKRDAFHECYEAAKAGIEAYLVQKARQDGRMNPSEN